MSFKWVLVGITALALIIASLWLLQSHPPSKAEPANTTTPAGVQTRRQLNLTYINRTEIEANSVKPRTLSPPAEYHFVADNVSVHGTALISMGGINITAVVKVGSRGRIGYFYYDMPGMISYAVGNGTHLITVNVIRGVVYSYVQSDYYTDNLTTAVGYFTNRTCPVVGGWMYYLNVSTRTIYGSVVNGTIYICAEYSGGGLRPVGLVAIGQGIEIYVRASYWGAFNESAYRELYAMAIKALAESRVSFKKVIEGSKSYVANASGVVYTTTPYYETAYVYIIYASSSAELSEKITIDARDRPVYIIPVGYSESYKRLLPKNATNPVILVVNPNFPEFIKWVRDLEEFGGFYDSEVIRVSIENGEVVSVEKN